MRAEHQLPIGKFSHMLQIGRGCGPAGLLLMICLIFGPFPARAADDCHKSLSEIRYEFLAFRYETVIEWSHSCLDFDKLNDSQKVQAYELRVLSYIEMEGFSEAKTELKQILRIQPDYVLTSAEPTLDVIKIMSDAKAEVATEKKSRRWPWIAVGAGVLAGTVAALLMSGDNEDNNGFPGPPGRPPGE